MTRCIENGGTEWAHGQLALHFRQKVPRSFRETWNQTSKSWGPWLMVLGVELDFWDTFLLIWWNFFLCDPTAQQLICETKKEISFFKTFTYLFIYCVCVHVCVCMCARERTCARIQKAEDEFGCVSSFSFFTVWVLGIELGLSCLVASALTHWTILPAWNWVLVVYFSGPAHSPLMAWRLCSWLWRRISRLLHV